MTTNLASAAASAQHVTTDSREADAALYLRELFPNDVGHIHVAGKRPKSAQPFESFGSFRAGCYPWVEVKHEQMLNRLAASIVLASEGWDVYACVYPHRIGGRRKDEALDRSHVHADIDGPLNLDSVRDLGGFAVGSGSTAKDGRPHGHAYLRLAESVTPAQHEALCRAWAQRVGGEFADGPKHSDNDVLRPPGTLNHKTSPPRPVTWLIRPDEAVTTWQPEALAERLGIDLPAPPEPEPESPLWTILEDEPVGEHVAYVKPAERAGGRDYVAAAVSGVLDELTALTALAEGQRDHRGHGWDSAAFSHACRLIELSNASDGAYPFDQARSDFLNRCPADGNFTAKTALHKWDSAAKHVGSRAAEIPERAEVTAVSVVAQPGATVIDADQRVHDMQSVFTDMAAILNGDLEAARPDGGPLLTDGTQRFYRGAANQLFGDPETAKTLVALASGAAVIEAGGMFVFIDTDHNGPHLVALFLRGLGLTDEALLRGLRYAEPTDRAELVAVVEATAALAADVVEQRELFVVLDSVGENLSLWGVSPNDDQGFIDLNRATTARLARAGCTVVTIDHLAKNSDSRKYGATGSTAKKRAADGAVYRVEVVKDREFSPTTGGASDLRLVKDRRGGVRALGVRNEEIATTFELDAPDSATGIQAWRFSPGRFIVTEEMKDALKLTNDVTRLSELDPPPKSKTDVMKRMEWGSRRALDALKAWREQQDGEPDA